ncbi:hypothetical protein G6011_09187 [Alternaria panax]|uniref:B-block binding subunit of TFIIIC domain-containing protein n=1 Tax=Alternaria panax TaxID=48097 RepID=A0AAD4IAS0_9PLEO|nr:hypothetical protein G6011_09187 [Alternaria panax]
MATGYDKLLEFLLSEIALRGVQGASSADFRHFIDVFYKQAVDNGEPSTGGNSKKDLPSIGFGRAFYERLWQWLTDHCDIRIVYQREVRRFTLSEFEAAELHETGTIGETHSTDLGQPSNITSRGTVQPSKALCGLRDSLRQRILEDGYDQKELMAQSSDAPALTPVSRPIRNLPSGPSCAAEAFDEPDSSITAPRLYASQSRVWQALTGHGIDLKKVPSMEFVLLSLIAARGSAGITQPELINISGQDKRSVPKRTDELARKNYIAKISVQSNKMRTSLCIHAKFVSQNTFIKSSAMEDVYQEDGTFVVRNFAQLLYNVVGQGGIVPTRSIREKLEVPMNRWNKRATQGALIRLDQSGMIKRRRVLKKASSDKWVTCIQVLREPREEDLKNLGFRRVADLSNDSVEELPNEDINGELLLKDLDADMPDDANTNADNHANAKLVADHADSIPPQWIPDRFLPNIIFNATALGGAQGWDAEALRNRIVGPFWRRPIESYFVRVTCDWEKTQPIHLRHLAVIRDAGTTKPKKYIHYLYRTYENFQKAVDAKIAVWEGVVVPQGPEKSSDKKVFLDAWGFPTVSAEELVGETGSATLSEAGSAIVKPRKNGPRWDNAVAEEAGYKKLATSVLKVKSPGRTKKQKVTKEKAVRMPKASKASRTRPTIMLTPEEKISLGLDVDARLSKSVQGQILAHRQRTGDPSSLPDAVVDNRPKRQLAQPLLTTEERLALGLAAKGRLGIATENKIRATRGLPQLVKKKKKSTTKATSEPTVLSKSQRIALGWTDHGRLPQAIIDGLRQEHKDGISLEDSKVIASWDAEMKRKKIESDKKKGAKSTPKQATPTKDQDICMESPEAEFVPDPAIAEPEAEMSSSNIVAGKRRAGDSVATPRTSKRRRTKDVVSHRSSSRSMASMSPSPTDAMSPPRDDASIVCAKENRTDDTSQSTSAEATQFIQVTPLPIEDSIIPSVEAKQSSRPMTTKVYVQLDATKMDAHARTAFAQYENRRSPGIFLNPYIKQKVARGRPRKALMATFKLPRLADLEWFTSEPVQEQAADRAGTNGTSEADRIVAARQNENVSVPHQGPAEVPSEPHTQAQLPVDSEISESRQMPLAGTRSRSSVQPQSPSVMELQDDSSNEQVPSLTANNSTLSGNEASQAENEVNTKEAVSSVLGSSIAEDGDAEPATAASPMMIEERTNAIPEAVQRQPPQTVTPTQRMVGGWAPINATERSRMIPYQSPYAASADPEARPSLDTPTATRINGEPVLDTTESLLPIPEADNGTSHSDTIHSAIVETPAPSVPGTKPRKAQIGGIAGTQRTLRQNLIKEIIKRCHGVFPGGGEISRPFLTLWKDMYPNILPPSTSTIVETLRNMSADPQFGLKHWNFASQHKNMLGTATRRMYTWAHLNERSPEVLKLAHNMAQYSQQKDYAHRVSEKSLLYYPEEIRDLIGEVVSHQPIPAAPKDESIILNQLNPELEKQITEAKLRKRSVWQKQKRLEAKARKAQNAQVEQASSKQIGDGSGATRTKRARLASLNDKSKKLRRAPLYAASMGAADEDSDDVADDEPVAKSGQISLIWTRPIVAPVPERERISDEEPPEDDESDDEATDWVAQQAQTDAVGEQIPLPITQPIIEEPSSNVTAAEPDSTGANNIAPLASGQKSVDGSTAVKKGKKRVRIIAPRDQSSKKRTRINPAMSTAAQSTEPTYQSSTDDDSRSASEMDDESEGGDNAVRSNTKKPRMRNFNGRQRGKLGPPPTLLERLTGLTGDPNDPIYQAPQRVPRPGKSPRSWNERKRIRINRFKKERQYAQAADSLDDFKKLFYTFIVVSSLSGEDGQIDWNLFKRTYDGDRFFDVTKAQNLWSWMQKHMTGQVSELTTTFQSLYLEAYETGKVTAIDNPETHDWAGLVRWAMRKCAYPDLPLPILRQALHQFTVDESNYEILDRVLWYKAATADRTRTMLQLQQSFTAPLHRSREATWSPDDKLLKARSWVRANTATPQTLYDANLAHEKFKEIGETVLVNVVGDLVDKQHLRMRKLKRLLPGRNYNFTQALAKKYTRLFQLDDFMNAVEVKKKMDAAFADNDPGKRFYNISRCEEDGAFAAIMTMVNEGTVKLAPQLPPVKNDFDASLPKLSVWGFCEGGYNHRAIDRGRLFWDIHVVPTANYKFGNPLQPLLTASSPMEDGPVVWPALPEPPLPGKHEAGALLPIWSSIDGQSVTWPWWYRVLNLVLQPLIFMAGATGADIHSHCPEHTTELFEIELVLVWLESINAVSKTVGGGYITLPGFWAAFGDQLRDTEDDWFGEHVKRKAKNHEKQTWRVDYNLRHSTLQARKATGIDAAPADEEGGADVQEVGAMETSTSREILKNPKQQYRIIHQALSYEKSHAEVDRSEIGPTSGSTSPQPEQVPTPDPTASSSHTPEATGAASEDVDMADAEIDAEGEEDIDAEGEIDDGMY